MKWWEPKQVRTFLESVRDDRLAPAWRLVCTTGLRRGELAGLRWDDVDLDGAVIDVRHARVVVDFAVVDSEPKTAKGRRVLALDDETVAALRAWRATQRRERLAYGAEWDDTGLVFTHADGRALHPDLFTKWFKRLAKAAGLPAIRLHDLRHSYASALIGSGVDPITAADRLGHADRTMTLNRYGHRLDGKDRAAADTVAALYDGGRP